MTVKIPGGASYETKLTANSVQGTLLRLQSVLPNGGNLLARILVDS